MADSAARWRSFRGRVSNIDQLNGVLREVFQHDKELRDNLNDFVLDGTEKATRDQLRLHLEYHNQTLRELRRVSKSTKNNLATLESLKHDSRQRETFKTVLESVVSRRDDEAVALQQRLIDVLSGLEGLPLGPLGSSQQWPPVHQRTEIEGLVQAQSDSGYSHNELFTAILNISAAAKLTSDKMEEENKKLDSKLAAQSQLHTVIQNRVTELEDEVETLKGKLDEAKQSSDKYQMHLGKSEIRKTAVDKQLQEAKSTCRELERKLEESETEQALVQAAESVDVQEKRRLIEENDRLKKELNDEKKKWTTTVEELEGEIDQLKEEADTAQPERDDLLQRLATAESDAASQQASLDSEKRRMAAVPRLIEQILCEVFQNRKLVTLGQLGDLGVLKRLRVEASLLSKARYEPSSHAIPDGPSLARPLDEWLNIGKAGENWSIVGTDPVLFSWLVYILSMPRDVASDKVAVFKLSKLLSQSLTNDPSLVAFINPYLEEVIFGSDSILRYAALAVYIVCFRRLPHKGAYAILDRLLAEPTLLDQQPNHAGVHRCVGKPLYVAGILHFIKALLEYDAKALENIQMYQALRDGKYIGFNMKYFHDAVMKAPPNTWTEHRLVEATEYLFGAFLMRRNPPGNCWLFALENSTESARLIFYEEIENAPDLDSEFVDKFITLCHRGSRTDRHVSLDEIVPLVLAEEDDPATIHTWFEVTSTRDRFGPLETQPDSVKTYFEEEMEEMRVKIEQAHEQYRLAVLYNMPDDIDAVLASLEV